MDYTDLNNMAERAQSLANSIISSLQSVNLLRCRRLREVRSILENNFNPTLEIRIPSIDLSEVNSGRFNGEATMVLQPGGTGQTFSMPVNIHDVYVDVMAWEVLKHIGGGFEFLVELKP